MDLDHAGGDVLECLDRGEVGDGGGTRRLGAVLVARRGGIIDRRPGGLDRDQHVGHAVLERLEAADRPAELDALLAVLDRRGQR